MVFETLEWVGGGDGYLEMIDQRLLPGEFRKIRCADVESLYDAIKTLAVRGAPAIGGMTDAISFTKMSEGLPALKFHRNGAASEEGILYLTSTRAAASDDIPQDTRALMVERATGRIRCFSYRTLAWVEGC